MVFKSIGFAAFLVLALAGCGGGGGGTNSVTPDSEALIEQSDPAIRQALFDHMLDRYLWFDQLPALDLSDDANADLRILLTQLRKQPEDRFSAIVNAVAFGDRFELGLVGSFGVRFFLRSEQPLDLRVSMVDDFGSVGLAGVQRGDRVVAAGGVPLDDLGLQGFVDLFAEQGLGVSRNLTIRHPDGRELNYDFTRTEHSLNPVRKLAIIDTGDLASRVAYVQVTEFIELTRSQLSDMRDFLSREAPDELILDMRYNPGGLVSASRDLASSLYGASLATDVYTVLTRNDKHRDDDFTYFYRQFDNALSNLTRVFILTTGATCSAAEEVINGLAPFLEVITVGTTTCGKPYAARPHTLVEGLVIANILESRSVNADGEGDFFTGLAPDCDAVDDPTAPFGDARDSLTATALAYIRDGACPQNLVLADDVSGGWFGGAPVLIDDAQMPAVAIAH